MMMIHNNKCTVDTTTPLIDMSRDSTKDVCTMSTTVPLMIQVMTTWDYTMVLTHAMSVTMTMSLRIQVITDHMTCVVILIL